jgi:hypothetical protein
MRTVTASRRAVIAAAVGLVLSVSLGACSQLGIGAPKPVGCSLVFIFGDLVADNGRVVLANRNGNLPVPLDWPDGWTVRPTDDGQLEVVDDTGTALARTGEGIKLEGVVDPRGGGYGPWIRDGTLVVCPTGLRRT